MSESQRTNPFEITKEQEAALIAAADLNFRTRINLNDAHGLSATNTVASGKKADTGKPDMSLLSNTALVKITQVMDFGKKKYAAHNWRGGLAWSRVLAAAARHLFAYIGGEDKDPETGLSHLAHASCCLMFLLEYEETHKKLDDRYKPEESK